MAFKFKAEREALSEAHASNSQSLPICHLLSLRSQRRLKRNGQLIERNVNVLVGLEFRQSSPTSAFPTQFDLKISSPVAVFNFCGDFVGNFVTHA